MNCRISLENIPMTSENPEHTSVVTGTGFHMLGSQQKRMCVSPFKPRSSSRVVSDFMFSLNNKTVMRHVKLNTIVSWDIKQVCYSPGQKLQ